ncbi:30S ribosomal protein S5 [Candidatus Woesebacteria bacterium]|nr:30S ribosomal protein S5 [Candidatus Woesebacteria bacterium]
MRDNRSNHQQKDSEFEEKMIQVSRVSKKTKGGNNVGFSVLMVVGDRKGRVGVGLGKASDVATAMKKGAKKAKKKMILVPLRGTTIPFKVVVKEGAGVVMLKPAPKGSGIIAGGPVRAVVDAAGIRDISSKILGSSNQASSVYATFEALKQIQRLVALRNLPIKTVASTTPSVTPESAAVVEVKAPTVVTLSTAAKPTTEVKAQALPKEALKPKAAQKSVKAEAPKKVIKAKVVKA